jgi:hypothetical protein
LLERLVGVHSCAWLLLPRESPFMLILYPGLVDPMWYSAYASNMNRRQIEARVQRTLLRSISGAQWIRGGQSTVRVRDLFSGGFVCMMKR